MRKPISSLNPVFYWIIVKLRQLQRYIIWIQNRKTFAKKINEKKLPYRVYNHQSVLVRKLGVTDMTLQYNKVDNLKLAIKKLNGIIIEPGEVFSFCYLVGSTTRSKGYKVGMQLSDGDATEGYGGGVCQIANLIHWLSLHSDLTVIERHHHSFDPFPDSGRVVPFGCGASIFYNYCDYQLRNDTSHTFQFLFWLDDKHLNGDLRSDFNSETSYEIINKNEKFVKKGDDFFRQNEIWLKKIYKDQGGEKTSLELIQKNNALVKYIPENYVDESEL